MYKDVIFYFMLILDLIRHDPDKRPWWNDINDKIILGAMPYHDKNHITKLKQCNIDSVITINEDYELEPSYIGTPVKPIDWYNNSIKHLQIQIPDATAPDLEIIKKCIDFIESNKKTYVHCKAGKGRSVLVIICYLMYKNNTSFQDTLKEVKTKRIQANLNVEQLKTGQAFYTKYLQNLENDTKKLVVH